jgi:hsp70-interacting protein
MTDDIWLFYDYNTIITRIYLLIARTSIMSATPNPWAWLGLLKWSLSYSDGTSPSDLSPMSKEDREFLEQVMKDGIIDENERMKTILLQVTNQMEKWRDNSVCLAEEEETIGGLLEELRDIVEQIDFARAFMALKGIHFLLGCMQELTVPLFIRQECGAIVATMAQHNPPVQKELLEVGALKTMSDLYFANDQHPQFQARLIQAISATVRQNTLAEAVFCKLDQALPLFESALRKGGNEAVQKRSIFFLSALLTSDQSDEERVLHFAPILLMIETDYLDVSCSREIREMSLFMLEQIMQQRLLPNDSKLVKDIITRGTSRLQVMKHLLGEEADDHAIELMHWEQILSLATNSNYR